MSLQGEIARAITDEIQVKLTPEEPVSTTLHGYVVYNPGFWSQGPAMLITLEGNQLISKLANQLVC